MSFGEKGNLRLHLGCGNQHFEGYVNIDRIKTDATDVVCGVVSLPYPDNAAEVIESYHLIEHLPRQIAVKALGDWYRILIPGGRLIVECPDFDRDVKEYMEGNEKRLDSIFGLQRFPGDTHLFGYNLKKLKKLLEEIGFVEIQRGTPQDRHAENEPCLHIECIKAHRQK